MAPPAVACIDFDGSEDDGFSEAPVVADVSDNVSVLAEVTDLALPRLREDMKRSMPADLIGNYAISMGAKSKSRYLHLLGACHRVPGLHYADFEIFDERPGEDCYHVHCQQCWKSCEEKKEDSESDSSSSSGCE